MFRHFAACLLPALAWASSAFAEPPGDAPLYQGKPLAYWVHQLQQDPLAREEAIAVLTGVGPAAKDALPALGDLLKAPNPGVRLRAAIAVWKIGRQGDKAAPVLAEALKGDDRARRLSAVLTLAEIGPDVAEVPPALRTALGDADAAVRASVGEALAEIGSPAVAGLKAALHDDDRQARVTAAGTLLRIERHNADAVAALTEGVKDADADVRRRAGARLLQIPPRPKEAAPAYAALLKDEYPITTRLDAADALWDLHKDAKEVLPALTDGLKDRDVNVRGRAFWVLARLGREARPALPELTAALQTGQSEGLADVMSGVGPDAVPPLLEVYRSTNFTLALQAGKALGRMGPDSAPALLKMLDDPDAMVRGRALLWLGYIGSSAPGVIPALVKAAADDNDPVRLASLNALCNAGPEAKEGVPVLLAALQDPNPNRRRAALQALRGFHLDPETALLPLNKAIKEYEDAGGRAAAVELRWRIDHKTAAAVEALASDKVDVPSFLVLGRIAAQDAAAVPAVAERLRDPNPQMRLYALFALEQAGPNAKAAIPDLKEFLKDKDPFNAASAARILARLGADIDLIVPILADAVKAATPGNLTGDLAALGLCGKAAAPALPAVRALVTGPKFAFRIPAAECLCRIDPAKKPAAVAALLDLLSEPEFHGARLGAAAALCRIDPSNPRAVAVLRAALTDPDPAVRTQALLACGQAGSGAKELLPLLAEIMTDEADYARLDAATAVWKVGGKAEQSAATLAYGLKDQTHAEVRRRAAVQLGEMGADARAAARALRDALKDRSMAVRTAAAEALPKVDPEAAAGAGIP